MVGSSALYQYYQWTLLKIFIVLRRSSSSIAVCGIIALRAYSDKFQGCTTHFFHVNIQVYTRG